MLTIQKIREDLKEIQFYYSNQRMFEDASKTVIKNSIFDKVERYTQAVKNAPARLYALYVALYVHNNTQATLAYDWDCSNSNIKYLNDQLCRYLMNALEM